MPMNSGEVRRLLDAFTRLLDRDTGFKERSSACSIAATPFSDSLESSFWQKERDHPKPESSRCAAFLAAYSVIGNGGFPLEGLRLDDGKYFRPDKAVVRSLIAEGQMSISDEDQRIVITVEGYKRIAGDLERSANAGSPE